MSDASKSHVFETFFIIFSLIRNFPGVLLKRKNVWVVGMITILFPCLIYAHPFFVGEVIFKDFICLQMTEGFISATFNSIIFLRSNTVKQGIRFMEARAGQMTVYLGCKLVLTMYH